jgi:hypothetical protein
LSPRECNGSGIIHGSSKESEYSISLEQRKSMMGVNASQLTRIVTGNLNGKPKCSHCQEQASLKIVHEENTLIGCYVCPTGYVSRTILYSENAARNGLKNTVSDAFRMPLSVPEGDLRVATRYAWDLAIDGVSPGVALKEVYWTQNYGRSKSNDPNRTALFLCNGCGCFYHQAAGSRSRLCPTCTPNSPMSD